MTTTIPTTLQVLEGTQNQRQGEYLLIKELGGMKRLVAVGTSRLIRFMVMHPATELDDQCKLTFVYQAKRSTFSARKIEFAIGYAERNQVQPKSLRDL